jgi:hypothetical protein
MNSWIDKYLKLKKNYKEEIKKLIENDKDMKISNHTLVNYSGKNLTIYKIIQDDMIKSNKKINKLYKKLAVIPQST